MSVANGQPVVNKGDIPVMPEAGQPAAGEARSEPADRKRGGGVRTPEGKNVSRRNSLDFGLWALKVFPQDLQAEIDVCTAELTAQFKPRSAYEVRLVKEAGRATAQAEFAELHIQVEQQRATSRVVGHWENDRCKDIEDQLAKRLPQAPERLIRHLRASKQGAEWIEKAWSRLDEALEVSGGWDEIQLSLAYDLLGVPQMFRNSTRALPPASDLPGLKAVVAREQAALRRLLDDELITLDRADQALASVGVHRQEDAELKRLRRALAWARRCRDKARAELLRVQKDAPAASPAPAPAAKAAPTPEEPAGSTYGEEVVTFVKTLCERAKAVDSARAASEAAGDPAPAPAPAPATAGDNTPPSVTDQTDGLPPLLVRPGVLARFLGIHNPPDEREAAEAEVDSRHEPKRLTRRQRREARLRQKQARKVNRHK
jgi:hypothetical protein